MKNKKIMILASGGIDSTALIHFFNKQDYNITCLHFQYGQPSAKSELKAVKKIVDHYSLPLKIITLNYEFEKRNTEYIGRNALFILMATSFSISEGIERIVIGINSSSRYYDCSNNFINDIQTIIDGYFAGTKAIEAPFMNLTKNEIIKYCILEKIPLDLTYSCLIKESPPCGKCGACRDRRLIDAIKRTV